MKHLKLFTLISVFTLVFAGCAQQPPVENETQNESRNTPTILDEKLSGENEPETSENVPSSIQGEENTIVNIKPNQLVESPVTITGETNAEYNQLIIELRDKDHNPKITEYALVTVKPNQTNTYRIKLNFIFRTTKEGYIAIYEKDENGNQKNLT